MNIKKINHDKVKKTIVINRDVFIALKQHAAKNETSMSCIVEFAIRKELNFDKKKE